MSAEKYERFLYQTKTGIALRKVIEKLTKKDNSEYIELRESTMEINVV